MAEGVLPSKQAWNRIEAVVRQVSGEGRQRFSTPKRYEPERGFQYVNRSSVSIPPWGVIAVTGVSVIEGVATPKATQPSGCCNYFVNADDVVAPGAMGWTQKGPIVFVRLDDKDDVPDYGDMLGPYASTWGAVRHRPGFRALGPVADNPQVFLAYQEDELVFKALSDGTIAADATGQADLCTDAWAARTDVPKHKLAVKNDAGVLIPDGARMYVRAWKWDPEFRVNIAFLCS
jgi:hypothetical protein